MDAEFESFMQSWTQDPNNAKAALTLMQKIVDQPGVSFEFKARPGISYSLRPGHSAQKGRNIFALIDVVDDEPQNRWLSVCFYADMITDPDELGDFVPQGLLGEDAACFNLENDDPNLLQYICTRLEEALAHARG